MTMATKKAAKKSSNAKKSSKSSSTPPSKRWSAKVTTDSTKPGPGLFKKSGKAIAEGLVKKSVSPKGPGQAMQMLSFYENRGGKNLPAERKQALETAKKIIRDKEGKAPAKNLQQNQQPQRNPRPRSQPRRSQPPRKPVRKRAANSWHVVSKEK
jgi:hypothetical protein